MADAQSDADKVSRTRTLQPDALKLLTICIDPHAPSGEAWRSRIVIYTFRAFTISGLVDAAAIREHA